MDNTLTHTDQLQAEMDRLYKEADYYLGFSNDCSLYGDHDEAAITRRKAGEYLQQAHALHAALQRAQEARTEAHNGI